MLKDKRKDICDYVKKHRPFLMRNAEVLDIYDGNLLPYIDSIMQKSLSPQYYNAIRDRIIPINIIQRYTDKVSTTYEKEPSRLSENKRAQEFVDYYKNRFAMSVSGQIADQYSTLFKGFAWKPYINEKGVPAIRELSFDRFLVMSDSKVAPEDETIFIEFMGYKNSDQNSLIMFIYTDAEFDACTLDGVGCDEYLVDTEGLNPIGVIPFVYGKRQKNKLIPTQDTDMLSIGKTMSVMLSDAAGAQMFQCFSVMYGIDVNNENMILSPNVFWSFKSDNEKTPSVGTIKPEADTQKVLEFVVNVFILWLETKGVRVGSVGSIDTGNVASGISKIIDEMDVYNIKKKSMEWFKKDEEELWNEKLPMIHNYWVKNGMIMDSSAPTLIGESDLKDMGVVVDFGKLEPMITRSEEIANIKAEKELGTMTREQAIRKLHPDYSDEQVVEVMAEEVF